MCVKSTKKGSVVCYACGQAGHIRRNCTNRLNEEENADNASRLQLIINRSSEKYIRAFIRGKPVTCLLDTGCEQSVVSSRLVHGLYFVKNKTTLLAANGTCLVP